MKKAIQIIIISAILLILLFGIIKLISIIF